MKPIDTKRYLKLFVQSSKQRVLEVLFREPEIEFSLSELAKKAKVAKPHIGKILKDLKKLELITIVELSKIWRIKANQNNINYKKCKIIYNLNLIYQSGLIEFLNEQYNNPKAIILFGSFRYGEDYSKSDIDIAIEMDDDNEYQVIRLKSLFEFETLLGRIIQLHLFNRNNIDIHVFNNVANGIVLQGFLEVKK